MNKRGWNQLEKECPACHDPQGIIMERHGPAMICIACDRLFWGEHAYSKNSGERDWWATGLKRQRIVHVSDKEGYEWEYLEKYHPIWSAFNDPLLMGLPDELIDFLEAVTEPYGS